MIKGSNFLDDGKLRIHMTMRHAAPEQCTLGSLAQHIVQRFTIDKETFPDPQDTGFWESGPLWQDTTLRERANYWQQRSAVEIRFAEANIVVEASANWLVVSARMLHRHVMLNKVILKGLSRKFLHLANRKTPDLESMNSSYGQGALASHYSPWSNVIPNPFCSEWAVKILKAHSITKGHLFWKPQSCLRDQFDVLQDL